MTVRRWANSILLVGLHGGAEYCDACVWVCLSVCLSICTTVYLSTSHMSNLRQIFALVSRGRGLVLLWHRRNIFRTTPLCGWRHIFLIMGPMAPAMQLCCLFKVTHHGCSTGSGQSLVHKITLFWSLYAIGGICMSIRLVKISGSICDHFWASDGRPVFTVKLSPNSAPCSYMALISAFLRYKPSSSI